MECMAVLVTPHPLPYEHWFEATMARKEYEQALEIADRARRHRFFTSLALGGRLESLRWVLEGSTDLTRNDCMKICFFDVARSRRIWLRSRATWMGT